MPKDLNEIIRLAYKGWKIRRVSDQTQHPDEETFVSFLEGKLSISDALAFKQHLIKCESCAEAVGLSLASLDAPDNAIPSKLVNFAREKLELNSQHPLEIFLRFKENTLEVIKANGDILLGQELVPAVVLRSRNINEFKDEVVILKDFDDVRVQVVIENKSGKYFNVNVQVKNRQSKAVVKDLRVTLFKENVELESYLNDSGAVIFEHVLLGKYLIEVNDLEGNLASVLLDIKT
jgi:hypothetical protein